MDKIALLADIHGNLAALHAVVEDLERWEPDLVIVAGDTLNRGPLSGACFDLVRRFAAEHGWMVMRGNHERYVLAYDEEHRRPDFPTSGPRFEVSRVIAWTHSQVANQIATIAELPTHLTLNLDGTTMMVYHASVRHDRDGIDPFASAELLRQQIDPRAQIFCIGHTHAPFVRRFGPTLVVNVGSVGLPFDGDQRAAYARLSRQRTGWQAEIVRLRYDVASTERIFHTSGMTEAIGAHSRLMIRELQTGQSLLFDFVPAYHDRIMSGRMSIEDAVQDFLNRYQRGRATK
ncbi:MAG: metallophosphoesterase [Chloroflexia bacterium]|nr:metallophosphoesterase [Chloroflexia bacterium]